MKTFTAVALAGLFAVALSCARTNAPAAPAGPASSGVELQTSYLLPQDAGKPTSHTPSVVFTADGKRMVTATSDNEIAVFKTPSRRLLKRVRFPEEGTDGVAVDASGRFAAWALKSGGLAVMEIESEKIVARDAKLTAKWLAASPDARLLALTRGSELEVRALPSLALRRTLSGHSGEVTHVAWSPDGARLASTAQDGKLLVHEASTGRAVLEVKKDAALYAVAFHPRGSAIAYGGHDKKVVQREFSSGLEEVVSKDQPFWITCLGYSPDGEHLAAGDESCDIWLYRLKTKELTFHGKHHVECWLSAVAWAPDNETFLFGCRPNSHAGKPALFEDNAWAEAHQSKEVQGRRDGLLKAVDAELARTPDGEKRKALEATKASLTPRAAGQVAQTAAVAGGGGPLTGATFGLTPDDATLAFPDASTWRAVPLDQLPDEVRNLAREHQAALDRELKRLKANFCINEWRVKK